MSILTGPKIRRLAEGHVGEYGERIVIRPFDPALCGPNSYDVHLGNTISMYGGTGRSKTLTDEGRFHYGFNPFDPLNPPELETFPIPAEGYVLHPGILYLASTLEYTETHGLAPKLEGRSSIARGGMKVHLTAGFGDDGFCGNWTLELEVTHSYLIRAGMKIAQICYTTLIGERQPYKGRYQGDTETVPSRFHLPDPK